MVKTAAKAEPDQDAGAVTRTTGTEPATEKLAADANSAGDAESVASTRAAPGDTGQSAETERADAESERAEDAVDPSDSDSKSGTEREKDSPTATSGGKQTDAARRQWALRIGAAAVVVVLIGISVTAGIFGWKLNDRDDLDAAAQQASSTAQSYAVTLTSIDSQHIDQNFTDVLNGATGQFKDMYSQSSNQLKALLVQNKAVSKGRVLDASVKSATKDKVVVLLFVDQEITNTTSPDPRVDRSRIRMTMEHVGGRWLASTVEMV